MPVLTGTENRTWTFEHSGPPHSANSRPHWRRRAELTRQWRNAAHARATAAGIPPLRRAHVFVEWLPPDLRRRDPANIAPAAKACVDGLVDAGVLPDDDATHLTGPDLRLGELRKVAHKGARGLWIVRVIVREVV